MTKNLLEDTEVDERIIERELYTMGEDNEGDLVNYSLNGQHKLALKGQIELTSPNPFIPINYVFVDGKPVVYPTLEPASELDVQIRGFKKVFNGNCSLVLGEYQGKRFVFFDPDSKDKDYEQLLDSHQRIKLAAISSAFAYWEPEDLKNIFSKEELKEFNLQGYSASRNYKGNWEIPLYKTIFSVNNVRESKENFLLVDVKNPLDSSESLELITNSLNLDLNNLEKIISDFYFIGRF